MHILFSLLTAELQFRLLEAQMSTTFFTASPSGAGHVRQSIKPPFCPISIRAIFHLFPFPSPYSILSGLLILAGHGSKSMVKLVKTEYLAKMKYFCPNSSFQLKDSVLTKILWSESVFQSKIDIENMLIFAKTVRKNLLFWPKTVFLQKHWNS